MFNVFSNKWIKKCDDKDIPGKYRLGKLHHKKDTNRVADRITDYAVNNETVYRTMPEKTELCIVYIL